MVYTPDEALKRAIKFFEAKGKVNADIGKMPMYNDQQTDRLFVNVFLGSHIQSKKPWKFNEAGMYDWIPNFAGKPIVLFKYGEHFEHPLIASASKEVNMKFQDTKKVGEVLLPFERPDDKGTWRGIGEVTIDKVKAFLRSLNTDEVPMFHSPQVAYSGPDYDIKMADPMHLAFTDDPAFPPEISMISGLCEGDPASCYNKLAQATAERSAAEATGCQCLVSQIRDLVLNNAAKQNNDSSLKISNFSSKTEMADKDNTDASAGQQTDQVDKSRQSPAGMADDIIKQKANDAVSALVSDINKRIGNISKDGTITIDPKATMDKALKQEDFAKVEAKPFNIEEDPKYKSLLSEVEGMKSEKRKESIAKIIPLSMVTDIKSGGINDKLLNEFVDYWLNTDKTPEQIAEYYNKTMSQLEAVQKASIPKKAKASNSEQFSNDELAAKMADTEPQFDTPDVDNADNNEKVAAGSNANGFNPIEFAGMLVSNVSKNDGKGAPRRMIE